MSWIHLKHHKVLFSDIPAINLLYLILSVQKEISLMALFRSSLREISFKQIIAKTKINYSDNI